MRLKYLFIAFSSVLLFQACSFRKIVVKASAKAVDEFEYSFMIEEDPAFAKAALPGLIKIAEGMYHFYPKHPYYASKLSFLYAAYTFAYLDETPFSDFDEDLEVKQKKLNHYYQKAFMFGINALEKTVPNFKESINNEPAITLSEYEIDDVEALFWTAFSWAMLIFNNTDNAKLVIELENVKQIADRVKELDESYMHGAVYAIYIAYYGGRTQSIGGNREKANRYYKKALEVADGKSLVPDFVYYRFVTIQNQNANEFDHLYQKISNYDIATDPDFRFINQVILDKSEKLNQMRNDIF